MRKVDAYAIIHTEMCARDRNKTRATGLSQPGWTRAERLARWAPSILTVAALATQVVTLSSAASRLFQPAIAGASVGTAIAVSFATILLIAGLGSWHAATRQQITGARVVTLAAGLVTYALCAGFGRQAGLPFLPRQLLLIPVFFAFAGSDRWVLIAGLIGIDFLIWVDASGYQGLIAPAVTALFCFLAIVVNELLVQLDRYESRLKFYSLKARDLATANVRLHDSSLKSETIALNRERLTIARELHDSVGYSLTSILMQLRYAGEVARREPERVATVVEGIESLTEAAARGIREQVAHIRQKEERERNWLSRAERLCDSFERVAAVRIHKSFRANGLPDDTARVIYSIVQEGINNAVLHGNASYIDIVCEVDDDSGCLILRISDNGIGAERVELGFGLIGIQERARSVNGMVEFRTAPGSGFDIGVDVPMR